MQTGRDSGEIMIILIKLSVLLWEIKATVGNGINNLDRGAFGQTRGILVAVSYNQTTPHTQTKHKPPRAII